MVQCVFRCQPVGSNASAAPTMLKNGVSVIFVHANPSAPPKNMRQWLQYRVILYLGRYSISDGWCGFRRLCRDHEGLPGSSEAFIKLSASYRMLTKLAPAFPS